MPTRLITFLGKPYKGRYEQVTYALAASGRTARPTSFVAQALVELYELGRDDEVTVLSTESAWSYHGPVDALHDRSHGEALLDALGQDGVAARGLMPWLVEDADQAELWQHFELLYQALTEGDADTVVLDVTHGYRPTPILAAAVVAYARVVAPRMPDRVHVVYGAYERVQRGRVAPVWDLTPLVELGEWTRLLTHLVETGRVGDIEPLVARAGEARGRAWAEGGRAGRAPRTRALASALRDVGEDLATLRVIHSTTRRGLIGPKGSVDRLRANAAQARAELTHDLPPLTRALDRVLDRIAPLADCDDPAGDQAVLALRDLAALYLDWHRPLEAAAVLREAQISARCPRAGRVPGHPGVSTARDVAYDPRLRTLFEVRNDLLHAGFSPNPLPPTRLLATLRDQIHDLVPAAAAPAPAQGRFLNLSNHPQQAWDDAQRQAALALGTAILDLPFPAVDPDADERAVAALADQLVQQVPDDVSVAMVAGEPCLAMHLVGRLQRRGVRCLAATTHRGQSRADFRFVRWRELPAVCG